MNMMESCLFVNWRGINDECPLHDGFSSYDVCLANKMEEVNGGCPSYDGHSSYIACPFPFLQSECESLAPFGK